MKDIFYAIKFKKIFIGICLVTIGCAIFTTENSIWANEPIIKEVKASKESFFGSRSFFVSVKHNDTGWEHYADGFEILTVSGDIISKRVLAHPHVDEQPVTRDLRGVSILDGIAEIEVRAHDTVHGYGPKVRITVPAKDVEIKFKTQ